MHLFLSLFFFTATLVASANRPLAKALAGRSPFVRLEFFAPLVQLPDSYARRLMAKFFRVRAEAALGGKKLSPEQVTAILTSLTILPKRGDENQRWIDEKIRTLHSSFTVPEILRLAKKGVFHTFKSLAPVLSRLRTDDGTLAPAIEITEPLNVVEMQYLARASALAHADLFGQLLEKHLLPRHLHSDAVAKAEYETLQKLKGWGLDIEANPVTTHSYLKRMIVSSQEKGVDTEPFRSGRLTYRIINRWGNGRHQEAKSLGLTHGRLLEELKNLASVGYCLVADPSLLFVDPEILNAFIDTDLKVLFVSPKISWVDLVTQVRNVQLHRLLWSPAVSDRLENLALAPDPYLRQLRGSNPLLARAVELYQIGLTTQDIAIMIATEQAEEELVLSGYRRSGRSVLDVRYAIDESLRRTIPAIPRKNRTEGQELFLREANWNHRLRQLYGYGPTALCGAAVIAAALKFFF